MIGRNITADTPGGHTYEYRDLGLFREEPDQEVGSPTPITSQDALVIALQRAELNIAALEQSRQFYENAFQLADRGTQQTVAKLQGAEAEIDRLHAKLDDRDSGDKEDGA